MDESYFLPADWHAATSRRWPRISRRGWRSSGALVGLGERRQRPATLVLHTVPLPAQVRDEVRQLPGPGRASPARGPAQRGPARAGRASTGRCWWSTWSGLLADAPFAARDDRLYRYADMPYTDGALLVLAREVRRLAQARLGLSRKVLALDLDNTLWGGVLGEVGADGRGARRALPG